MCIRDSRQHWPNLAGVGMIERRRDINGTVSMERAFYIGSKGVTTAESFAKAARSHWGIENSLHWVLDVTSVSYTHLDVYKRQWHCHTRKRRGRSA